MRFIKPGTLGTGAPAARKAKQKVETPTAESKFEVWDYPVNKRGKKLREYEKDDEGRLVKKPTVKGKDHELDAERLHDEPEYKPRTDYAVLEERLGYTFKNRELLQRALTHRSVLGFDERTDYERLEFLGDAVLDLAVAHHLSMRHTEAREGDLSKMRAALVNTQSLADIARRIEAGPFIRLGRGELSSGGNDRPSILADVMEAMIGAMFLDSNYDTAQAVIEAIFAEQLDVVTPSDPKTELQEALHAAGSEPPEYFVELVEGPQHAPTFVTVVVVDGEVAGRGKGNTKKAAQQEAASIALAKLWPSITQVDLAEGQTVFIKDALLVNLAVQQNQTAGAAAVAA